MRRLKKSINTRSINIRKWTSLIGMALFAPVLMFYQNCAPPSQAVSGKMGDVPPPSIIDDINLTTGVSFVQKTIELQSSNLAFDVHGICSEEQSGARLAWSVYDERTNVEILRGFAECSSGGFQVSVNDTQELECGKEHILEARLGVGKQGQVTVVRRCNPSVSKPLNDPQLAMQGLRCFYELDAQSSQCEKSCYQTEVLKTTEYVDRQSCVN